MVKPAKQDFEWKLGATWDLDFWLRDDNGAPIDLTGATPQLRVLLTSPDTPIDYNPGNSRLIVSNPTGGKLSLSVSDADNGAYTWQTSKYFLAIRHSNGKLYPYLEGTIKLTALGG